MAITESYEQQGQHRQPGQQHLPPDAVAILKADHDLVESLFAQCEQAEGNGLANTTPLIQQVFQALHLHTMIEEECVYPLAGAQIYEQGEPMLQQFRAAHGTVKQQIESLRTMDPNDSAFRSSLQELIDAVRAHVDEEEATLFPDLEGLSAEQHEQLTRQMHQRRQQLIASMQAHQ